MARVAALVASFMLVVVHWDERGSWFWVGVALFVLNVVGLLGNGAGSSPRIGAPDRSVAETEDQSHRLVELLGEPGVAAAFAEGPQEWRQVSYLEDPLEPITVEELAEHVWIEHHDGWEIGLGEELKPYLDLDVEESDDPMVAVLLADPRIVDAYHEDREVYRIEARRTVSIEELAPLVARGLVAHHVRAAAR